MLKEAKDRLYHQSLTDSSKILSTFADPRMLKFGLLVKFGVQLKEKIEKVKFFLLQDLK